jgi:nucleoside-diphosphate-sugar epimerase
LSAAPETALGRREYLMDGVKPTRTAAALAAMVREAFPGAEIRFRPNPDWQAFLEMYAIAINDAAARSDWGWVPEYDYRRIIEDFVAQAACGAR